MRKTFSVLVILWGFLVTSVPWAVFDSARVTTNIILTMFGLALMLSGWRMYRLSAQR